MTHAHSNIYQDSQTAQFRQKTFKNGKGVFNNKRSSTIGKIGSGSKRQSPAATLHQFRMDSLKLSNKTTLEVCEKLNYRLSDYSFTQIKDGIMDLWECIAMHCPNHKEFSEKDSLHDVFDYIKSSFKLIKNTNSEYSIMFNQENEYYYFYEFKEMEAPEIASLELNILPQIGQYDIELHDLLLKMFAFLHRKCQMNFMGKDEHTNVGLYIYEHLSEEILHLEEENCVEEANNIKVNILKYEQGIVNDYYNQLNQLYYVTLDSIEADNNKYDGLPIVKQYINEFISFFREYGIHCVQQFDANNSDPDFDEGMPIMYSDTVQLFWSCNDEVFKELENMNNQIYYDAGLQNPSEVKKWYPTHTEGNITGTQWPLMFSKLIDKFNQTVKPLIIKTYGKSNY